MEGRGVDLSDAGSRHGFLLNRGKVVGESLRAVLRHQSREWRCMLGVGALVEPLELQAALRRQEVWPKRQNLPDFDREQPHPLDSLKVDGSPTPDGPHEPEKSPETHGTTSRFQLSKAVRIQASERVSRWYCHRSSCAPVPSCRRTSTLEPGGKRVMRAPSMMPSSISHIGKTSSSTVGG